MVNNIPNNASTNSVLITGITGFIGVNLKKYFQNKGYNVIGITRNPKSKSQVVWDEIRNQSAHVWIHAAGKAHDVKGNANSEEYNSINLELTKKVFECFIQDKKSKDFIFLSSVKAVASHVGGVLTEEDELEIDNPYGESKREAEKYLLEQKVPSGKRLLIFRLCMTHGPGNKGNLNLLYQFVRRSIPYPLGAFKNERSFLSVENLCFITNEVIKNPNVKSGVYQVSDDGYISTQEIVQLMAETLGIKAKVWDISPVVIKSIARIGDFLRLPVNSHRLKKLTESYRVSNSKIKSALQIESLPISGIDGLKKTLESFKRINDGKNKK